MYEAFKSIWNVKYCHQSDDNIEVILKWSYHADDLQLSPPDTELIENKPRFAELFALSICGPLSDLFEQPYDRYTADLNCSDLYMSKTSLKWI